MSIVSRFAAKWQKFLPALVAQLERAVRNERPATALFAGVLVIYFIHQIEEHLAGASGSSPMRMFHFGDDSWRSTSTALRWSTPPMSGC